MLKLIIILATIALVLGIVEGLKFKFTLGAKVKADIYYLRKSLFTQAERSFLGVLEGCLPPGIRVFGKVRLEDIIGVKNGMGRGDSLAARNRINRKHVDFLLVRASDLAPLAGIELDDSSHEEFDRQQRDAFVDSAFTSAGLPLLHQPVQNSYNPSELNAKVVAMLNPTRNIQS